LLLGFMREPSCWLRCLLSCLLRHHGDHAPVPYLLLRSRRDRLLIRLPETHKTVLPRNQRRLNTLHNPRPN
jgi:hypothetical protein